MQAPRSGRRAWAIRLIGIALLAVLLLRLDLAEVRRALGGADLTLVALAVLGIPALILIKTVRWRAILESQSVRYPVGRAFLAYMGSLFVGFLTPGRLGEFVKAVHVARDSEMSPPRAFSSVLTDRLFDLYALLLVGGSAVAGWTTGGGVRWQVVVVAVVLLVPLVVLLAGWPYGLIERLSGRFGTAGQRIVGSGGWLTEIRAGLLGLRARGLVVGTALTTLAYLLFFGQCFLLARALVMPIGFTTVLHAVGLGSLVTLVPISISGLGTREAVVVAYLGSAGVAPEVALSFSLLVFLTFYVAGGLIGALAWWLKPVPVSAEA